MKVSVIVATYNEKDNIERLLSSLRRQTFGDFETIVVDNYSTDQTRQIAQKFSAKVYKFGKERSAQRNYGLQKARGQYILFVDADMELEKTTLEESVNKMENDQKLAGTIISEVSVGQGFLGRVKNLEKKIYLGQEKIEAARFFRKKDLKKLGGYNRQLISGEDWDLSQRIKKLGRLARTRAKIYHHEQKSFFQDIRKKYYYALHIQKYAEKYPQIYKYQAGFARFQSLFKKPKMILGNPIDFIGLLFLKSAQYLAYLAAKIALLLPRKNE